MTEQPAPGSARPAAAADVRRILGDLDDAEVMKILSSQPSLGDLEDVATCMAGGHDVLAKSGHHVAVAAARIIELLTDREQEPGQ